MPKLSYYANRHEGGAAAIIASGPSNQVYDPDTFTGTVICINNTTKIVPRFDYAVSWDPEFYEEVRGDCIKSEFIGRDFILNIKPERDLLLCKRQPYTYCFFRGSTLHFTLHLCYIMGFKEVHLFGVDGGTIAGAFQSQKMAEIRKPNTDNREKRRALLQKLKWEALEAAAAYGIKVVDHSLNYRNRVESPTAPFGEAQGSNQYGHGFG